MKRPLWHIASVAWISVLVTGCATSKTALLPQDLPSMKEIYEQHFERVKQAQDPGASLRNSTPQEAELPPYRRTSATSLDTVFPRLPNPDLVMFVYPHLAGPDLVPVPGYATTFPLYERVEYALPGEVPAR